MTDFFDDLERQLVAATPDRARRVRRARTRRAAALFTTLVALLACGAAIAAAVDGGNGDPQRGAPAATTTTAPAPVPTGPRAADPDPSTVVVAVLNATRVPGLARGVANRLQNAKFKIGNVTNAASQRRTRTVVYFARADCVPAATQVAQTLNLSNTNLRQMTAGLRAIAGDEADVVVVVGSDQNTSPAP
jgi:LytR cell envelope-related transcriptional attenuator